MAGFDLMDGEWTTISPLPPARGRGDDRRVFNLRTGAPWSDLSECHGPRTTVENRYVGWGHKDVEGNV